MPFGSARTRCGRRSYGERVALRADGRDPVLPYRASLASQNEEASRGKLILEHWYVRGSVGSDPQL